MAEIEEVLGSRTQITYEDYTKLKYILCVFKETLRLYPPAPEQDRYLPDDYVIQGVRVPGDTEFMVLKRCDLYLNLFISSNIQLYI